MKIRPYRKGGYEVDIMIRLANGKTYRERRKSPYSSKSASLRWGRERERHLLVHGTTPAGQTTAGTEEKEVPTMAEFADRYTPMTKRLASVLGELKQAKRSLVFTRNANEPISPCNGRTLLGQALDGAELRQHGPHSLRHTFCSHLAMRGAAARVIQQLAGHSSLITTQRYMHLSPGATEAAIALLESPPPRRANARPRVGVAGVGDMLETASHRPPHTP
ncbi:Site-specific recombinase, phage integrase family protein [Enhygromyxa salina]|uniref:Site-specific recombinase, phage integrase family protein n=1 Tax=Enhygromyxa salina TaxID=215803 RepID=A0A0C1ZGL3_9BACT|nr:Site-specific recombinase, phage integrase family protein [Enhygromyxa salina]